MIKLRSAPIILAQSPKQWLRFADAETESPIYSAPC